MGMKPHDLLQNKAEILKDLLSEPSKKYGNTFDKCAEVIANALKKGNTIFWCVSW